MVGDVPTRSFKESKSELRVALSIDKTRSHGLKDEHSSFEMVTSSSRASTVFHESTFKSGTSEESSQSLSKRRDIKD